MLELPSTPVGWKVTAKPGGGAPRTPRIAGGQPAMEAVAQSNGIGLAQHHSGALDERPATITTHRAAVEYPVIAGTYNR